MAEGTYHKATGKLDFTAAAALTAGEVLQRPHVVRIQNFSNTVGLKLVGLGLDENPLLVRLEDNVHRFTGSATSQTVEQGLSTAVKELRSQRQRRNLIAPGAGQLRIDGYFMRFEKPHSNPHVLGRIVLFRGTSIAAVLLNCTDCRWPMASSWSSMAWALLSVLAAGARGGPAMTSVSSGWAAV